ncbi:MAG: hypothetical protein MRY64_09105 [Hyphomonadaceae bacterium]|nr:hypothetical protein [Hyphomonadaceae bacterium]
MGFNLRWKHGLFGLMATGLIASAGYADPVEEAPPPCAGEPYDDFDFWLGSWRVHDPDGIFLGENVITAHEDHCLLIEHWISEHGNTGQSYNFYDPAREEWRQVWASDWGLVDYSGGLNNQGQMILVGEITFRDGTTAPFMGSWTPNEDGSVTQSFKQFDADTSAWVDWFTGVYTPMPDMAAPEWNEPQ